MRTASGIWKKFYGDDMHIWEDAISKEKKKDKKRGNNLSKLILRIIRPLQPDPGPQSR